MADVTGAPLPTGASPFDVPGDLKDLADHFGDPDQFERPTPGDLPATGNWPGRTMYVTSDGTTRLWTGSAWIITFKAATAPGSVTYTASSGFNITTSNNQMYTRDGWVLGTVDWTKTSGSLGHADQLFTLDAAFRPTHEYALETVAGPAPSLVASCFIIRPDGIISCLTPPSGRTTGSLKVRYPITL